MEKYSRIFMAFVAGLLCLCWSCNPQQGRQSGSEPVAERQADTLLPQSLFEMKQDSDSAVLSSQQVDSLEFRLLHHYSEGFNFVVKSDSLVLVPMEGDLSMDTCVVRRGTLLVVAQVRLQQDTCLIKVASNQYTMGWVEETTLLRNVVPDDGISQLLDMLTMSRGVWMSVLVALGVLAFFFFKRESRFRGYVRLLFSLDSFYPPLLLMLVGFLAALYASVQDFVPEFWQEYYFHPTLNPLLLPPLMATLVVLVWLILIVYIAVVIEVYNNFFFFRGMVYLLELTGMAMVVYLVISQATLIYVGYLLLPLLVGVLTYIYFHKLRCHYVCGNCGHRIRQRGRCPYCGAEND